MYQITFYVPETHLEEVKNSLFAAGAGKFSNYSKVAWQVKGEGQFCAQEGSNPFLGEIGKIEHVIEYKVELVCVEKYLKKAIKALKIAHPYEEPAYSVVRLIDV
ncbi:MAG: NGG1p interacting factor NIF3 [Gammaproteobacteria bacterium]|jgi:hypothetical protein